MQYKWLDACILLLSGEFLFSEAFSTTSLCAVVCWTRFQACQKVTAGIGFCIANVDRSASISDLGFGVSIYIVVLCILTNCFLIMKRAWQRIEINDYALWHYLCRQSWNEPGWRLTSSKRLPSKIMSATYFAPCRHSNKKKACGSALVSKFLVLSELCSEILKERIYLCETFGRNDRNRVSI